MSATRSHIVNFLDNGATTTGDSGQGIPSRPMECVDEIEQNETKHVFDFHTGVFYWKHDARSAYVSQEWHG